MSLDAALLLLLIANGAIALVLHVALVWTALRAKSLSRTWRALSLVPVVTPFAGWRAGAHGLCVAWMTCLGAYAALRWIAALALGRA